MGRGWRAALGALLVACGLGVAAHGTAPVARAECDGGLDFAATAATADAVVIGRVVRVSKHANGFVDVTAVRVQHAYRITTGTVYEGRAVAGWCPDRPRAGSLVVVLIGIRQPVMGNHSVYFVVTQSITYAQAASVGGALPDTSTAAAGAPVPTPGPGGWPLWAAGALGLALAVRRGQASRRAPADASTSKTRGVRPVRAG